jgi:hypothetical protein
MKTKTDRPKPTDGDKRPAYTPRACWIAPGEDWRDAQRRAWMTPNEFAAWKAATTAKARDKIEATAQAAAQAERAAEMARSAANIKRDMLKAYELRAEAADRERQAQDDLRTLAEAARANMPTKRKPGPGRNPYYDQVTIKRVESTIKEHGGSIKAAAETLKEPYRKVLAIHEAARKRRGRKA